jgi:phosphate transport system protein
MAFSKATANLERMGDEAAHGAHGALHHRERRGARAAPRRLRVAADLASGLCARRWTPSRLDTRAALAILKEDDLIDRSSTASCASSSPT